jgi:Na+-driven multidrug efflux pump
MALAYLRVIFLGLPFSMLGVLIQMASAARAIRSPRSGSWC